MKVELTPIEAKILKKSLENYLILVTYARAPVYDEEEIGFEGVLKGIVEKLDEIVNQSS